jgi:phosphoribosylamine-glycine ligase
MTLQVMDEIVYRTAHGIAAEGMPFRGTLFAGLMIKDGRAKLLEHNVRFGDPECQGLMARCDSDLLEAMLAAAAGGHVDFEHACASRCGALQSPSCRGCATLRLQASCRMCSWHGGPRHH